VKGHASFSLYIKITALLTIDGAHYNRICTTLQGKVAYIAQQVLKAPDSCAMNYTNTHELS